MERILITGAAGQLGSELTRTLADIYGGEQVVATDINAKSAHKFDYCQFRTLDVMDKEAIASMVETEKITQVYHLAAMLSATSEKNPLMAWKLNIDSLLSILELARTSGLNKIYWPSSIAVFGPNTPAVNTPQDCIMDPNTVYGISKLAGERWCQYYFEKYGVDVRSIRYPGLIGYKSLPGGGTTDYAVEIFHKALADEHFECFLEEDTSLPMMYMEDAIQATIQLMQAPASQVTVRSSYNLGGISFTPDDLYQAIKVHHPNLSISYHPDFRQKIADTWPDSIDDSIAQKDWGWKHKFDLETMTKEILANLPAQLAHFK
ncbi:L-threonine 3-dehydrogenase [Echinicola pacifica]|uniref:L-threonine 3-dehydrogenase n=1 Tax=Echinicola pacifica TaxID=346377 RepID=A0A918UXI7_9BACT|nr:NAD-dependent epimerase/dehydratase family protein [Echinicola pacifica]GGZ40980.1 L-threonine 3-dehydrogenase [Echinicola pacifica]